MLPTTFDFYINDAKSNANAHHQTNNYQNSYLIPNSQIDQINYNIPHNGASSQMQFPMSDYHAMTINNSQNQNFIEESNYPYFSSYLINGYFNNNENYYYGYQYQQSYPHSFIDEQFEEQNHKKSKKKPKKAPKQKDKHKSKSPHKDSKSQNRSRNNSKKSQSFESMTNLSNHTFSSDESTFEDDLKKNTEESTKSKKGEESTLHNVFQNILIPGIIRNTLKPNDHNSHSTDTNHNNNNNNNENAGKSNSLENSKIKNSIISKSISLKQNFSFKKLADKISSSAVGLKDRLNSKKTPKVVPQTSTFYSDISKELDQNIKVNDTSKDVNKNSTLNLSGSSVSDEYEDLNSTISVTNLNFSEKSSINLNESIVESNLNLNDNEVYYSRHDCDFWCEIDNDNGIVNNNDNENKLKTTPIVKEGFDNVIDLNEFWNYVENSSEEFKIDESVVRSNPLYDVPLYQCYDDLISTCLVDETKSETKDSITTTLLCTNLWSQLPDVKNSGQLEKMNKKEIELQERWFEIFHSELSYNKTLLLLNEIIISECKKELSEYNLNLIFTRHIDAIIQISNTLIEKLKERIKSELLIVNLFDILFETFNDPKFEVYIAFAGEQASQKENFDRLIKENKKLHEITQSFNNNPKLEGRDILSFLIAPVQRVPRYKLLVEAVIKLLPKDSDNIIEQGNKVLVILEKILQNANEKAKKYSSIAESIKLKMLLRYDNQNLIIPNLVSTKRYLLYHTDLISLSPVVFDQNGANNNKKLRKSEPTYNSTSQNIVHHLILFTDILIVTLKIYQDEKNFYYRVIKVYNKENVKADLAEWKMPFLNQGSVNTSINDDAVSQNDEPLEPCSSFLLTLTIKNDNTTDRLVEFRKLLDIKYCFICNRLEGEEWIRHLNAKTNVIECASKSQNDLDTESEDVEYLRLNTENKELFSNNFIQLVSKEDEKHINLDQVNQHSAAKQAKLKKKIMSLKK